MDDNTSARDILHDMLETMGLQGESAPGGEQAMDLVRNGFDAGTPYDLILMDWQMQGMDGIACAQALRRDWGQRCPPVILVSASGTDVAEESIADRHTSICHSLTKPVQMSRLHEAIAQVLGKPILEPTWHGARQRGQESRRDSLRGFRVLLVEDNPLNQELALELLDEMGIVADVAENGASAVAAAQDTRYDLILMDMQMPVMDGLESTRRIRQLAGWETAPILAMTASVFAEDRERCLASGMNDFVAKPIDTDVFHAILTRWLRRPSLPGLPDPVLHASHDLAAQAHAQRRLASIPGLDLDKGLKVTNRDATRLLQYLDRLHTDHAQDVHLVSQLLAVGQRSDARRVAHTLKGLAGTFGLTDMQRVAAELETALLAEGAPSSGLLQRLQAELETMAASLGNQLPNTMPRVTMHAEVADWAELRGELVKLRSKLEAAELTSARDYEVLRPALEAAVGEAARTLGRQIEEYEFDVALLTLTDIQSQHLRLR